MTEHVRVHAPGRVNLIGDHTDHQGGLALPCAIDLGITITGERSDGIELTSTAEDGTVAFALPVADASAVSDPSWGRFIASVAALVRDARGIRGVIESDLPVGAGLSSSAAVTIATALALGADPSPMDLALLAQRAEHLATGVPTGLLDQLAITNGMPGHALCIDFTTRTIEPVPVPDHLDIVLIHSGLARTVEHSEYAPRVESCAAAAAIVGPLPDADPAAIEAIDDAMLRRRARHVRSECDRVRAATDALRADDAEGFGALMVASHRSLRDDFEVSTPRLDGLVEELLRIPGVHGARLTGAGFGGCVVAVCESGAIPDPAVISGRGWIVRPSGAACTV